MTENQGDILAVDDTPASLKLLTDTLEAEGYQVRSATSGELALDAAASEPPELVLLDIRMPGMDGFEVCRRLKARPETRDVPVIFISALSETAEKVAGFELGAVDYVTKPYQREELLARVRTRLELHRLRHHFERMVDERTAELRANEEALTRLNRELRAISNCNQALMREVDEQTLLNDVCRIVCDEVGYRMVFVAYAENDEAKTIRPVAWAGVEEGYLEQAKLTSDDTEQGRGPGGIAARTGESVWFQDFATDPQAGPWRDAALRRGYRSVIALPLKDESANTFGILAIYSATPNAFTLDEIRLLKELADDLAFGVTALRARIERNAAKEKLIKSEERLRLSLDAAQIGSFDWDVKNDVFVFSPTYYTMLGYEPKSEYGDRSEWLGRVHPDDRPIAAEQIQKMLSRDRDQYGYEVRMLHADGSYRWQHVKGYAVEHDSDGKVARVLGVRIDISESKQAEEEIAKLNHELQRRLEALEEAKKEMETFSYSVSHDLKIPLRAIDGFICMMREEYGNQLAGEGQRYLDVVRRNTARMARLIDGLLDFISLAQRQMGMEQVDMGALAREVFEELRAKAPERNIRLRVGDLPPARCDQAMIHRALANLLGNAIKFTSQRSEALIEIGGAASDKENAYFVRDNGAGFDMHYIDKLFGVFLRLHSPEDFEGPGVGLAVVKRIIDRHGGRVWAEGKVGEGATFHFTLPRIEPAN